MSTKQKLGWLLPLLVVALFAIAITPAIFDGPAGDYISPEAEAGMHKNASGQLVCAHLNSTASAADHTSGTVTVYYHNNSSFVSDGTATHVSDGVWCYTLSQAATNYRIAKILWKSTGAVTLLQSYATTGYDDTDTYVPANVTHINATAQSGGRVYADTTHIGGTLQTAGDVMGALNTANAHLVGTLGAGTHTAQTGDAYSYISSHINGTLEDGSHLNSTALVDAIDTDLSSSHGPGPWAK